MRTSGSLGAFEESWKQFLHRIERVWNKAQAHYGRSPKWHGWASKHEHRRKKDPLLCYLIHARGADEHSINEIVEHQSGGIGINPAEGTSLRINRMQQRNGRLLIDADQPLKIEVIPGRVTLIPVTNRGRVYPVPTVHLGQPVDPRGVPELATLAVEYYRSALMAADTFFIK